jgi:hypothetical protein
MDTDEVKKTGNGKIDTDNENWWLRRNKKNWRMAKKSE